MLYYNNMKRLLPIMLILIPLLTACRTEMPPAADSTAPVTEIAVSAIATPAPQTMPAPTPDPLDAADGTYTIAWLSDTQHYSRKYPLIYEEQTRFLAEQAERLNLVYTVHTGDLVHNREDEKQWAIADGAMASIDHLPYGVCAGNHDVGSDADDVDYSNYGTYFGEARFADKPWYGGSYQNNRGHYDLIDAGNTAYLFVYLGYHIDRDAIDWANGIFRAHPNRMGVLCVHSYFDTDLKLTDQGKLLHDGIVAKNENVYLVLCGHRYNSSCVPTDFDDDGDGILDRTVLQMICNYQAAGSRGGDGYLRLIRVDEAAGMLHFYNYSPLLSDYVYFDTAAHQAENYAFDPDGETGSFAIPWQKR